MKVTGVIREAICNKVFEAYKSRIEESMAHEEELVDAINQRLKDFNNRYESEANNILREFGIERKFNRSPIVYKVEASSIIETHHLYSYARTRMLPTWLQTSVGDETYEIIKIAQSHIDSIILQLELGEMTKAQASQMLEHIIPRNEVIEWTAQKD